MEAKTLQIANIQKDEEFETLPTRIMPMIKQAVRYEHLLPGIYNPLKELKVLERICLEGASLPLFLLAFFKCFWKQRYSRSRVKMLLVLVFKKGQGPLLKDLEHYPYSVR